MIDNIKDKNKKNHFNFVCEKHLLCRRWSFYLTRKHKGFFIISTLSFSLYLGFIQTTNNGVIPLPSAFHSPHFFHYLLPSLSEMRPRSVLWYHHLIFPIIVFMLTLKWVSLVIIKHILYENFLSLSFIEFSYLSSSLQI